MTTKSTALAQSGSREPGVPETPLDWAVGTAAFLVELALAGTLAVAAYRLAGGGIGGWIAGAAALVGLFVVWGTWMSPKAGHRLPVAGRLLLGCGLVLLVAALAYWSGLQAWGWWLGIGGLVVTAVAQGLAG